MKRLTPLVVVALAVAAAFAFLRNDEGAQPDEDWKPVQPT